MFMAISLIIADDVEDTRAGIRRLLSLDPEIKVIGEAADGRQAVEETINLKPDIVLMDINMPVMDGITATEEINFRFPETSVVIMSVQEENEYLKRAMLAGARDYIVKPFSNDELVDTIKRVYRLDREKKNSLVKKAHQTDPQIISFFGTKGGVGKTTLAVNTAIAIRQKTRSQVVLVDLDLQFGDVAAAMNIKPLQSIADMVQESSEIDRELLESYLLVHKPTGVKVLCAPLKPEHGEIIGPSDIEKILKILKETYQYVIVDTACYFSDPVLTALEMSSTIFMVSTLDILAVKNTKMALNIMENLNMHGAVHIILNCADETTGMKREDLEHALGCEVLCAVPTSNKTALSAINKGIPFVLTHPNSNIGEGVMKIAHSLIKGVEKPARKKRVGLIAGLMGIHS
jgi:pilus assembly protein CpaE